MAPKRDSGRGPVTGKSGNLSTPFAVATENNNLSQTALPTRNPESGSQKSAPHPVSRDPGSTACTMMNDVHIQHDKAGTKFTDSMISVMDTASADFEQLESEIFHFMNLAMDEKKKSKALSEDLTEAMQKKDDVERRVQQIQEELNQARIGAQETETMVAGLQQKTTSLNASIHTLKNTGQKKDIDLENLSANFKHCTKIISELEDRVEVAETELAQKTRGETELRQRLDETEKNLKSQRLKNTTLQETLRQVKEQRDNIRNSNASTKLELTETVQTANTLSELVKRKIAELEEVRNDVKERVDEMQQDLSARKEVKELIATKNLLIQRNEELKSAVEEWQGKALVSSQTGERAILHLEQEKKALQQELETERERLQQENRDVVDEVTQKVQQHDQRRVRTVAICVDLSGSVSGSGLTEGVRRFYSHLLDHLKRSTCKTHVMVVVHGPGRGARVKSEFGSSWTAHENALEHEKAYGSESYVACLLKIKGATLTGMFLSDLQIILIGDGQSYSDKKTDIQSLCGDFTSRNPPVPIHSVVVQRGAGTGKPESDPSIGWVTLAWHTWDYSTQTKGNTIYWGQDSPLPDLGGFLF